MDENMQERKRKEKKRIMGRQPSMRLDQLIQTCFTLSLIHFYVNLLVTAITTYKSSCRAKVVDAANGKEEPSDKCVEALQFLRDNKQERRKGGRQTAFRHCWTTTNRHLWHLLLIFRNDETVHFSVKNTVNTVQHTLCNSKISVKGLKKPQILIKSRLGKKLNSIWKNETDFIGPCMCFFNVAINII